VYGWCRSALQCLTHERRVLVIYERQCQQCPRDSAQFAWTSFYKTAAVQSPDECLDVWYYLPDIRTARADRHHSNVWAANLHDSCQVQHVLHDYLLFTSHEPVGVLTLLDGWQLGIWRQIFKCPKMILVTQVMNILGQSCDYADHRKILSENWEEITSSLHVMIITFRSFSTKF